MNGPLAGFERRVASALDAAPSRIPVVIGGCGTGRTQLAERLRDRIGRGLAQYVDIEHAATTPERFLQAVTSTSPFAWHTDNRTPSTPRAAFDALLGFLDSARAPGGEPATFILDEVLEIRTFESFPGLRHVMHDLTDALAKSSNRFVLTTRYAQRAFRALRDASPRYELLPVPALTPADVCDVLAPTFNNYEQMPSDDRDYLGRAVQALTDGRVSYVAELGRAMGTTRGHGADPISALAELLSPDGTLDRWCRFRYELRLHRARGYGALKAILDILSHEEPLTLTEISQRLHRTPGSTKDYLSWLEDVDLVTSRQKRYSFTDPLLRLWVAMHCRPNRPSEEEVVRDVQRYALARVPQTDATPALAYAGLPATADERKSWGIIEID